MFNVRGDCMDIKIKSYLRSVKPFLKKLLDELLKEFSYASILATDSIGKRYSSSKFTTNITDGGFIERGFVVKVFNGINYSEYAFNEVDIEDMHTLVNDIKFSAKVVNKLGDSNNVRGYEQLIEEEIEFSKNFKVLIDPKNLGDQKIINKMIKLKNYVPIDKEEILDFRVVYEYLNINKLFLSPKKDLEQGIVWSNSLLLCIASNENGNKMSMKSYSGVKGAEILDEMKDGIDPLVKETLELLNAKKISPGEYDVICSPDITGLIAHEAFGHGVEMDMFLKDRAKSKNFIGQYVASSNVTMHDGAASIKETGSYFFDDEGNLATDTIIIENGILKSGINDSLTALALNKKATGNGRRESFDRKAYTRMTNTYIEAGKDNLDDMIKSIEYGFLLDGTESGMEDPKNWGIQCVANIAREIKDGRLTGKVFSPVVMTGYVPDVLKSISMISKDFKVGGAGYCGKGYKEFVKVSDGGPYIKCRVRLG